MMDEWNQYNFEELCEIIYRYPSYYGIDYVENGIPEVRGELINKDGSVDSSSDNLRYISEGTAVKFPKTTLRKGDIVLSVRGTIGKIGIIPPELEGANMTANLLRISPSKTKVNQNYFKQLLLSRQFQLMLESITTATTIKTFKVADLKGLRIAIPSLNEQQKIASILSSVDEVIEKTEEIIKQTETVKKGIARSIFRHKSGNKLMKLGDITDIKTGGTPSRSKEEYWVNGKIKWMASGDIHQGYVHEVPGRITELGLSNSNTRMLPIDTVMIALNGQGKTRGTVAILQTELTCNQSLAGLLPNSTLDSYYLYYNLQARYNEIRNYTGEGTRTGLNLRILKNIEISVPSVEKQSKTVEILQSIDKKIQIENAQKQTLLEVKKGLMQQLLTGKVRVSVCH